MNYYIVRASKNELLRLAGYAGNLKKKVVFWKQIRGITDSNCPIYTKNTILIVYMQIYQMA